MDASTSRAGWVLDGARELECLKQFEACMATLGPRKGVCLADCPDSPDSALWACLGRCSAEHDAGIEFCLAASAMCRLRNSRLVPPPPPPPRYTLAEKQLATRLSQKFAALSKACAALAAMVAAAPPPPAKAVAGGLAAAGFAFAWMADQYEKIAKDPPSRVYRSLWIGRAPSIRGLPAPSREESPAEPIVWELALTNMPLLHALTGVAMSLDRASGAGLAGAAEHEARQLRASQIYAENAAAQLSRIRPRVASLIASLAATPIGGTIVTAADVESYQEQPPGSDVNRLLNRAARIVPVPAAAAIAGVRKVLNRPEGTFGRPFVDYFTDPDFVNDLEAFVPVLERYASSAEEA